MTGRTLAIGDIHGCDVALETLLSELAPTRDDTLVVLGDVVDRGPDTRRCIELLLGIRSKCRLILLAGNHEEMMLDAIDRGPMERMWLHYGGLETLGSYGGDYEEIPPVHVEFLRTAIDSWESGSQVFIHANLEPGVPLEQQNADWLRWQHLTGEERPDPSGRRIVCGHTSQKSGRPLVLDGWVCIDTWAFGGRYLTCLDVDCDLVWQTSQGGEFLDARPLMDVAVDGR